MARNMRKSVKDKDHLKTIRKNARQRWRNKKANEKIQKNLVNSMKLPEHCQHAGSAKNRSPGEVVELPARKLEEKPQRHRSNEPRVRNNAPCAGEKEKHSPAEVVELPAEKLEEKPQSHCSDEPHAPTLKEICQTEIVRSEKFLGCGTFGTCYLAHYRGCLVTMKEFKVREKLSLDDVKKEVLHEATMITHLGDHPCLPLLFGVVTRSLPLCLVTQFHGEKEQSLTLSRAVRKKELGKQNWLEILKGIRLRPYLQTWHSPQRPESQQRCVRKAIRSVESSHYRFRESSFYCKSKTEHVFVSLQPRRLPKAIPTYHPGDCFR